MTEEELRQQAAEMGAEEVYPQEDGGVVYVMTEEAHQNLLKELSDAIEEALKEMVEGEEALASLRGITHTDDYSKFVFEIDRNAEDGNEGLYALSLTISGAYYQAYSGAFEPMSVVELKDAETGEVYESVSYQDWLDFINSFSDWGEGGEWGEGYEWESSIPLPELDETVLLDQEGITVTATGFSSNYGTPNLDLHVENTSDKLVYVGCDYFIINGYATSAWLYTEVQPGSEADDYLSIYDASLDILGTDCIGDIELRLYVVDEEFERICDGDIIELRTSDYDKDWRKTIDGEEIFSDSGITVKFVSLTRSEYFPSYDLTFVVENNGDRTMDIDFSSMLVNGYEVLPWAYKNMYPGTMSICALSISDEDLQNSGNEYLDSVGLSLMGYDTATYEQIFETPDYIDLPIGEG